MTRQSDNDLELLKDCLGNVKAGRLIELVFDENPNGRFLMTTEGKKPIFLKVFRPMADFVSLQKPYSIKELKESLEIQIINKSYTSQAAMNIPQIFYFD